MARAPKAPKSPPAQGGPGHNKGGALTDDEQAALVTHYALRIIEDRRKIEAEANGYRAGRRGDDPVPPKTTHPMFHSAWTRGYHKGVEENGKLLAKAGEILSARAARKPELHADDDGEEGGDFGPTEEEAELEGV
jgi:hypothetical protein